MLPPYVIGCTARDVYTWRWRYITLCEREENQSTLSVHMSGNFTYCNFVFSGMVYVLVDRVQPDGCQMASVVMGMKYYCVHCCGPEGALLRCMRPIVP